MRTQRKTNVMRSGLRVERLEDRRLMAGDVTAQVINGSLVINEAPGHIGEGSNISITKLNNGAIRVSGGDTSVKLDSKTLVNGQAYVDFLSLKAIVNLKVNLGDGHDMLHMDGAQKYNAVDILMGKLGSSGNDADVVDIKGLTTSGSLNIDTADGNDQITIKESHIGDGTGPTDELNILAGTGADTVTLGDTMHSMDVKGYLNIDTTSGRINGAENRTELGDDKVSITSVDVKDSLSVVLGGGNDTMDILGSSAGYKLNVSGGDGMDTVKMRDVIAVDGLFANMGAGDDRLELYNVDTVYVPPANVSTTDGTMQLDGGTGFDTLIVSNDCNSRLIAKMNWEQL